MTSTPILVGTVLARALAMAIEAMRKKLVCMMIDLLGGFEEWMLLIVDVIIADVETRDWGKGRAFYIRNLAIKVAGRCSLSLADALFL